MDEQPLSDLVRSVPEFEAEDPRSGGPPVLARPEHGEPLPGTIFRGILFPPTWTGKQAPRADQPACFTDLNLDQVLAAIVADRDDAVLRPIFHTTYRDEDVIRYRQAVFADLGRAEIFDVIPAFCEAMRMVRANLAYAEKITVRCHRHTVILRAVGLYCEAIQALIDGLQAHALTSEGLRDLLAYLTGYAASADFTSLAREARDLTRTLAALHYGMMFRGDKVTVRRYASEADFAATILSRFARFRPDTAVVRTVRPPVDDFSLNHIEAGILELVGRLFPDEFRTLADFVTQRGDFIDTTVAAFDREVMFFVSYMAFIEPLKRSGLPFCLPAVSATSKETEVCDSFDIALAAKLVAEQRPVVTNGFHLTGAERMIVVTGANQGGKTTFARMFGQLHVLAALGCPVPGSRARLFLPDQVFTHFEMEEDIANLRGKLEDELVRMHQTCLDMTPDSVVILNEIFNSTSLEDQVLLSTRILERILGTDALGVCVTFLDALATLSVKTVSMVSSVDPDDPANRTFHVVRRTADGLAYALSLADKRGVTYERLRARIQNGTAP